MNDKAKLKLLSVLQVSFFSLTYTTNSMANNPLATFLWGEDVAPNIQFGAYYSHVPMKEKDPTYKPYVGITYNSINVLYTKNCAWDNSFGLSLQRNLKSIVKNDHKLALGYRAGAVYGWCYANHNLLTKSNHLCRNKIPILPAIELLSSYQYKNVGAELSLFGPVVYLNLLYFFNV